MRVDAEREDGGGVVGCAAPPHRCWRCLGHLLPCRLEVAIGHLSRLTHPEHAAVALTVRAALPGNLLVSNSDYR
jgi:hypothetical protein